MGRKLKARPVERLLKDNMLIIQRELREIGARSRGHSMGPEDLKRALEIARFLASMKRIKAPEVDPEDLSDEALAARAAG